MEGFINFMQSETTRAFVNGGLTMFIVFGTGLMISMEMDDRKRFKKKRKR